MTVFLIQPVQMDPASSLLLVVLCSPAISHGFTILGEVFAYVTVFRPTIEVVTFGLRGWCVLDMFFVAGIYPSRT